MTREQWEKSALDTETLEPYFQALVAGLASPVSVALPDGTIVGSAPTAASEAPGRTHVDAALENQTSTQTVYTVTSGKRLWLAGFALSIVNSGLGALGRVAIYDGATLKIPFLLPSAVLGALTPAVTGSAFALSEPVPFTTSVRVVVLGGTVTYSTAIVGYEEDL